MECVYRHNLIDCQREKTFLCPFCLFHYQKTPGEGRAVLPASDCPLCAAPWQEMGSHRHHCAVCFASLQSATAGREPRLGQPAAVLCSLFLSPQQPLGFMGTMGWCDWSLVNTNSPLRLSHRTGSTDSPRIEIRSSLCCSAEAAPGNAACHAPPHVAELLCPTLCSPGLVL